MTKDHTQSALATLQRHGKSFHFARLFLGKETGVKAARLYAFCRAIDDIVDEPDASALLTPNQQLAAIRAAIESNDQDHAMAGDFIRLCAECGIDSGLGLQLITGVVSDSQTVRITNQSDLIEYAYLVAGVVGLMMSPILGAPKTANAHAIDLGIAMQLTNIARDVLEDAQNNRRYLPGDWIDDLSPQEIAKPNQQQQQRVEAAINRLLDLADDYYRSGFAGISSIASSNQLGIRVAASVYREIGCKLRRNHCRYLLGRTVVGLPKKIQCVFGCLRTHYFDKAASEHHRHHLHHPIQHWL